MKDTLQIVRLGSKVRHNISNDVEIWGIAGLSHRVEERMPGASGEVIALSLPFNIPGATMRQNWGEGSIGLVWSLGDGVEFRASVGATTDGDTAPLTSTRFGVSMPL